MKRSNISIFIPFAGCPNKCSYCDQHKITGQTSQTTPDDVKAIIETALNSGGLDEQNSEIAFFGGSFTAIDREYMISLLKATESYIDKFKGIRVSTRPDCIDRETLTILKEFGVTSIELGAQSMDDKVLLLNNRGHNSDAVRTASSLIKEFGFSLGLQMMTGLYGSSYESDIFTAQEFIKLKCDTVRIYPTVLLKNTYLEVLFNKGEYMPQNVESAVEICSILIPMFEDAGISVIRVGLHSSDTLEENIITGAYHPAFRELCENRIFLNKISEIIQTDNLRKGRIDIFVSPSSLSKAIGQNKMNFNALLSLGYEPKFIEDSKLINRQIYIQEG